jgi:hypothetical protein
MTPYNTGKVLIGKSYVPPKQMNRIEGYAALLQTALLNKAPPSLTQRLMNRLRRWL